MAKSPPFDWATLASTYPHPLWKLRCWLTYWAVLGALWWFVHVNGFHASMLWLPAAWLPWVWWIHQLDELQRRRFDVR